MPVWNGVPTGPVTASLTDVLTADQFYVHAHLRDLQPGETYHYRFVYTAGKQTGYTPDATFTTAPDATTRQPFTFTAYGDQGITGAPGTGNTLDNAVSLQPESDSHITDDYYDPTDPDYYDPASTTAPTDISPVAALVHQITKVRNPHNHTRTRFNLLAGDICYANPSGDAVAIINPDGEGGTQPGAAPNTPAPPANSGGWDDFDPYVWTSYLSQIEPSSASTPWMFATGNHDVELFSAALDADATTIGNYGSIGYGGHAQRLDLPKNGPSKCPSVYSFTYSNVAVISVDANDLSYEIQGLLGYSEGSQAAWVTQHAGGIPGRPEHRLHRRLLPPLRLLHLREPLLRRRRALHAGAAVRRVRGGPGDPGPQPPLRADQPDQLRRGHQQRDVVGPGDLHLARGRGRGLPRQGRHHLRRRRLGGPAPLRLVRRGRGRPQLHRRRRHRQARQRRRRPRRRGRRRSARTSASGTSPTRTSRSTGPRPGTATTPSSPSTSSPPGPAGPRR